MLKRVETTKTPIIVSEFVLAFIEIWQEIYNAYPKKESVGVILSQWSIETGQGKSCWNFNIGNVKAADVAGQEIECCALTGVWEIINGQRVVLPQENPGSWFRAFRTLKDGMRYHLHFLKDKRYKSAWAAVENGSVSDFAHLLKTGGYYTATESSYISGMNYFFNMYMKTKDYENAIDKLNSVNAEPTKTTPEVILEPQAVIPHEEVKTAPGDQISGSTGVAQVSWLKTLIDLLKYAPISKLIDVVLSLFKK